MWRWVALGLCGVACAGADRRANEILELEPDLEAGQADYNTYCSACHAPTGVGIPGSGSDIRGVSVEGMVDSVLVPPPNMSDYSETLTDQQIANVAAYAATL